MRYFWGDFCLDPKGTLLTRRGRHVDVTRKVLDCVTHLIEHRGRVVESDELSRAIWGHDKVSNHQLSQIVFAARRAVDDDGQAQRLIRTIPGIGYRWIGEVTVEDPKGIASAADRTADTADTNDQAAKPTAATAPVPRGGWLRGRRPTGYASIGLGAVLLAAGGYFALAPQRAQEDPDAGADAGPIAALERALHAGDFETVRHGLATLPPRIADSPDARILEVELEHRRGRNTRALDKLDALLAAPEAVADPLLRARLLVLKSRVASRARARPEEAQALAQSALDLLDGIGPSAPGKIRGEALERRAMALFDRSRLDEAMRDLVAAVSLLEKSGETRAAANARSNMARIWMRKGQLRAALEALDPIAEDYRRWSDRIGELHARNTMARIQMELLRWDDALASIDRSMALLGEVPDTERRYRSLSLRAQVLTGMGRLRLAESQLDEASASGPAAGNPIIPALHRLESGDAEAAMSAVAGALQETEGGDDNDILFDGKAGTLLIWITAAQLRASEGAPMAEPPAAARAILREQKTTLARIARGRWLWSQGELREAEAELRAALEEARGMHYLFRMSLAAEPLVGVLLQRNDRAGARKVLDELRDIDPPRFDRDYRFSILRLRLALADGNQTEVGEAHRRALALAGERRLPADVERAYARRGASGGLTVDPGEQPGAS